MYIIFLMIGIVLMAGGLWMILLGSRRQREVVDEIVERKRKEIQEDLKEELEAAKNKKLETQREILELESRRKVEMQRAAEAKESTDRVLMAERERLAAELKHTEELLQIKLEQEQQKKKDALNLLYKKQNQDLEFEYVKKRIELENELEEKQIQLDEFRSMQEAVNQAILRQKELQEKEDFYRIVISEDDIKDIEVLKSIESRLVNKEVLNKLIYKTFIEKPLMNMEKRVLGGRKIGGIYKITYIKTGESYIGRSVDIGNRWREHVLSSLSIGTIAHSTFHNVLAEKGIQNFTWEVLEEVPKEKQSEREKYYINFYGTKNQYNEKDGG